MKPQDGLRLMLLNIIFFVAPYFILYLQAPEVYLRNKIRSYGGEIRYNLLYSGYNIQST